MKIKPLLTVISLVMVFCITGTAMAMTDQERNTLIAQLQAQIAQLYQQITQLQSQSQSQFQSPAPTTWCYSFNTNIRYGNTGAEVTALHNALQDQGFYIGVSELENQKFEDYTTIAINGFQEKYASEILHPLRLSHGTSFVGKYTRKKLNQLYNCSLEAFSESISDVSQTTTCTPNWKCGNWSTCVNNSQTRICTDSNNCGTTTNKPLETQSCISSCTPNWECENWSTCINSQQTRNCYDSNYCGVTTGAPSQTQSCVDDTITCIPDWTCANWSSCDLSQQTRTCTDSNNCSTNVGKPAVSQYCSNPGGNWGTCKNYNIPGLTFSCLSGTAPYGISGDFIISYEQYLSWASSFGSQYTLQYNTLRDCGCSWTSDGTGTWYTKISCASGSQCDPSKVPNKLKPGSFIDYCSTPSVPDIVQWSSRISKGESQSQALQNTINDNKINMMIGYEKGCVRSKIYYVGGDAHSPNWMCKGDRYRLNPDSVSAQWQKWVNGEWTTNFGWNSAHTCQ